MLEKFAGYGFNRSHSAAYAWVSYQTAFSEGELPGRVHGRGDEQRSREHRQDQHLRRASASGWASAILAPDVNKSGLKFAPEEVSVEGVAASQGCAAKMKTSRGRRADVEEEVRFEDLPSRSREEARALPAREAFIVGSIRFGLAAIKNVGEAAMEAAIAERDAERRRSSRSKISAARVDSKKLNKKSLECLVKCGAFDWTGVERAQLFAEIDGAIAAAASAHRDRASGQVSMFDDFDAPPRRRSAAICAAGAAVEPRRRSSRLKRNCSAST